MSLLPKDLAKLAERVIDENRKAGRMIALLGDAELDGRLVEGGQRLADVLDQPRVVGHQVVVVVEAAERAQEDLAPDAQCLA